MATTNKIEETLNSLEGIQKAEANPFLYAQVMARLEKGEAVVVSIAPRVIWQAAACFAVLITLNVLVWAHSNNHSGLHAEKNNPVVQEYLSYLNNNQF
jgi:hypothetical protein